jgi:hypothetical protein
VRNKLPQLTTDVPSTNQQVQENDQKAKAKMKANADRKRRASPSNLKIGDLVRQRQHNKFFTCFDPRPLEVVRKKGTMVTAYRDGKYITRNISQFKVIDLSLKEPNLLFHRFFLLHPQT